MTAHRDLRSEKMIRANRASSKLLDYFLWSNKSNIHQNDNDFPMLSSASTFCPNSSLLAFPFCLFVLCSLGLAGNNSAGRSSSTSVVISFLRRIQSFYTSTERSSSLSKCKTYFLGFTNESPDLIRNYKKSRPGDFECRRTCVLTRAENICCSLRLRSV